MAQHRLNIDDKIVGMPFVFGRETSEPHGELARLIDELLASISSADQAIGWNLKFDDRVSEERAAHFYQFMDRPATVDGLKNCLQQYVKFIEDNNPLDSYLNSHNQINIVNQVRRFTAAHVYNVSAAAYRVNTQTSKDFSGVESMIEQFLRAPARNENSIASYLNELFLEDYKLRKNRPVWITQWSNLKKHFIPLDPDALNSAVGLSRAQRSLQLVLCYPAQDLQLVRPTQLDIGFFQNHFPSPAVLPANLGGFTMSLRNLKGKGLPLLPEFLHPPRNFTIEDWSKSEFCWSLHPGSTADEHVDFYRQQHLERLQADPITMATANHWKK